MTKDPICGMQVTVFREKISLDKMILIWYHLEKAKRDEVS